MERKVINFNELKNSYYFDGDTVSYIIKEEKRLENILKTDKNINRYQTINRINELRDMYSSHNNINIITNEKVLSGACEAINALPSISIERDNYMLPFGIYGYLKVSDEYLKDINYDQENFRRDLFDKLGFEYYSLDEMIHDDRVDMDKLSSNGINYTIDGPKYEVNMSFYELPNLYDRYKDMAPKTKIYKK